MEPQIHTFPELFAQLGLPDDEASIETFIATHRLPGDMKLADAPFWTPSQAAFLKAELGENADWSTLIDEFDVRLRS